MQYCEEIFCHLGHLKQAVNTTLTYHHLLSWYYKLVNWVIILCEFITMSFTFHMSFVKYYFPGREWTFSLNFWAIKNWMKMNNHHQISWQLGKLHLLIMWCDKKNQNTDKWTLWFDCWTFSLPNEKLLGYNHQVYNKLSDKLILHCTIDIKMQWNVLHIKLHLYGPMSIKCGRIYII